MSSYGIEGTPPVIEDGAMIINGIRQKSLGGIIFGENNYFQSFVSVKRGFENNTFTDLGHDNYIASFTNIGHNVKLGGHNYLAPGVRLGGYTEIGDHVYLGMNVAVVQNIKIGNWVKVAAGNLITRNIPSNTYVTKTGEYRRNNASKILSGSAGHA